MYVHNCISLLDSEDQWTLKMLPLRHVEMSVFGVLCGATVRVLGSTRRVALSASTVFAHHGGYDVEVFRPVLGSLVGVPRGTDPSVQRAPRHTQTGTRRPVHAVAIHLPDGIPVEANLAVSGPAVRAAPTARREGQCDHQIRTPSMNSRLYGAVCSDKALRSCLTDRP